MISKHRLSARRTPCTVPQNRCGNILYDLFGIVWNPTHQENNIAWAGGKVILPRFLPYYYCISIQNFGSKFIPAGSPWLTVGDSFSLTPDVPISLTNHAAIWNRNMASGVDFFKTVNYSFEFCVLSKARSRGRRFLKLANRAPPSPPGESGPVRRRCHNL